MSVREREHRSKMVRGRPARQQVSKELKRQEEAFGKGEYLQICVVKSMELKEFSRGLADSAKVQMRGEVKYAASDER